MATGPYFTEVQGGSSLLGVDRVVPRPRPTPQGRLSDLQRARRAVRALERLGLLGRTRGACGEGHEAVPHADDARHGGAALLRRRTCAGGEPCLFKRVDDEVGKVQAILDRGRVVVTFPSKGTSTYRRLVRLFRSSLKALERPCQGP